MQHSRVLETSIWLLLLLVMLTLTANASKVNTTSTYENHASKIINEATERMQSIWSRQRDIFVNLSKRTLSSINTAPMRLELERDDHQLAYELALNLSVIPLNQIKNPILRRQVQRLSKLQLHGLKDIEYHQSKELLRAMNNFLTNRKICDKHSPDCTKLIAMVPNIVSIMRGSVDVVEVEHYWFKWRKMLNEGNSAKITFIRYIKLLKMAANYNGHVTPSRTWYLYYDTENFQRELEDVVWAIMPLYRELHAYLRHTLHRSYPTRIPKSDSGLPANFVEQLIHQAWYPNIIFRTPYPDVKLPPVQARLIEILGSADIMNKKTADFFESLGLNHMSETFYRKFTRPISDEENGHDCKSEVFYFPPDVGLRYCTRIEYKKLMQVHGYMAELQYNIYKKDLPFGLDTEPCPGFGAAIAETAVISSGTPRHLHRMRILYNESLSDEESLNRLMRMALHTILAVPQYFIYEKFLVEVLDGHIGLNDYNCAYWRLQNKYAGVVPPLPRSQGQFDPDYKFYKGLNPQKSSTMKFISEVLGYQFYRAFCLASDQYRPGDPNFPLHNCDYYGSAKAGELIKNMMQMGATKHWRDVLEIGTGERTLSAKGLMEYFAPLFTWLQEHNNRLGLERDWDDDIKCYKR